MADRSIFSETRLRIRRLTASAMLSALGVILLWLGSLLDVLDISMAVLTAFMTLFAVIEIGGAYPWLIWIVTGTLSLLLLPQKSPALLYALMTGYYPMIKWRIERLRPVFARLLKFLFFNAVMTGLLFLTVKVLGTEEMLGPKLTLGLYLLGNPAFLLCDIAMSRLTVAYVVRWQKKLHFRLK